jgi:hypothetical protein
MTTKMRDLHNPIGENSPGFPGDSPGIPHDLFEIIETLPLDIQNLLGQFEREGYDYQTCAKYLAILESKGYTFEYNLDGTPFNLTETK